jgi:hypothetical protein
MLRGLEALGAEAKLPSIIAAKSFIPTPSKTIPITPHWWRVAHALC